MRDGTSVPLVVDVDGSLVNGDLLIEGVARLLATAPLRLLALPFWLSLLVAGGRAALKRRIARAVPLPPATLSLNPAVVQEIAAARTAGREVWLASASDEIVVAPLVEAAGATGCLASDGRTNLAGRTKAAALVERFGDGGFDYIGNERRDLAVWQRARRAIGVGLSASLARSVRGLDSAARLLPGPGSGALDWFLALRPRHWIKNALVFGPAVAAHETRPELYLEAAEMFLALSACASGTYLWNDLADLPHDRRHHTKRHRPVAAGRVPLLSAAGLGTALVASGLLVAFGMSAAAGLCVLSYLALTVVYSLWLKRQVFLDVVALAVLFTVRVLAGEAVTGVALSHWFLAFSTFLFLALAIVKRQRELYVLREAGRSVSAGRAYVAGDLPVLGSLAVASSFASVLVLALYIQSPTVAENYARPEALWSICLLLLYWLGRITLLANRGTVDDDPLVFAMSDPTSWLTGGGILAAFVVSL